MKSNYDCQSALDKVDITVVSYTDEGTVDEVLNDFKIKTFQQEESYIDTTSVHNFSDSITKIDFTEFTSRDIKD